MINYDQPGMSNLWLRARAIFAAKGLSDSVEWVNRLLSRRSFSDRINRMDRIVLSTADSHGLGAGVLTQRTRRTAITGNTSRTSSRPRTANWLVPLTS